MRHIIKKGIAVAAMLSLVLPLVTLTQCTKHEPNQDLMDMGSLDQETANNPTYHFIAGEVALDRDDYEEALNHYLWLAHNLPDPVFAARATTIAIELQNYQAASETSQLWASKSPTDLQTQAIAASLTLKTGCAECAKPYIQALLTSSDMETMQHLMQVYAGLDDKASQDNYLSVLTQLGKEKQDTRALFVAADLQYQTGDLHAANQTLDSIHTINPTWIRANALRIQILYENGHKKEAYTYLNNLLEKDQSNVGLKWLFAKMSIEMGNKDKGLSILKTIKNDPSYGNEATLELVKQYIQIDKLTEARTYLNDYQAKNPKSDEGFFLSGFIAQEAGKIDQAIHSYQQVKEGIYYLNARVQWALCQTKLGHVKEALAEADRLIELFPEDIDRLQLVHTQILLDSNQYQKAYDALNQIISSGQSTNLELHYVRGLVAIELNNTQGAMEDLKFVINKNPKHIQAINILTETLINNEQLDEARHYNALATRLAPNNPEVLGNTGWLKLKEGNVDAALPYLLKAYKATGNPDYAAYLGEALWQQGQKSEAVNVWNHGLEKDPHNNMVLNAMRAHLVRPASNN